MADRTGRKRNNTEKFYTKDDVALSCIHDMIRVVNPSPEDLIVEPSAGNGSFLNGLLSMDYKVDSMDILPENQHVRQQDFFTYSPLLTRPIHLIGNPPFGRQASLAFRFIKKASEYASTISFILPKSFKKDSFRNRIPLSFHLVFEKDLPNDSFYIDDTDYDVPCVFQIWKRMATNRERVEREECNDFEFVSKEDEPHLSIRRVGIYAGKASTKIDDKNPKTHYFIRFTNEEDINANIEKFSRLTYESMHHTVGPKSLSKHELVKEWNRI